MTEDRFRAIVAGVRYLVQTLTPVPKADVEKRKRTKVLADLHNALRPMQPAEKAAAAPAAAVVEKPAPSAKPSATTKPAAVPDADPDEVQLSVTISAPPGPFPEPRPGTIAGTPRVPNFGRDESETKE